MVQALLKLKSLMSFNHRVRGKSPFLTKLFRIFGFNGFKLFHSADFQIIANSKTVCLFKVTSRGELPSHKVTYCNRREAYKNIQKEYLTRWVYLLQNNIRKDATCQCT